MPLRATAQRQLSRTVSASNGMVIAASDDPQFPRPASTPCAKPVSFGLNQREVMAIPTTKPVPTALRIRRDMSISVKVVAKANQMQGTVIDHITRQKVLRGPSRSHSMPTMTRIGTVRATLQIASIFS